MDWIYKKKLPVSMTLYSVIVSRVPVGAVLVQYIVSWYRVGLLGQSGG